MNIMDPERACFEAVEHRLWEDASPIHPLHKGRYKKSFRRWGHAACVFGGFMYVFGGEVDSNSAEVPVSFYKICLEDLLNNMWSLVSTTVKGFEVRGRDSLSSVVAGSRWMLLFGNSMKASLSEILIFDFRAQTLSRFAPPTPPIPREAHASALLHHRFVVCYGGITTIRKRNTEIDRGHKLSIWDIDLETFVDVPDDSIVNGTQFRPRKNHTLTEVGGQLAVFGGSTVTSINKTNPDDLFSDLFLIRLDFFEHAIRSVPVDDPLFVRVAPDVYAKAAFVRVNYDGPHVQLHSHNANLVGNDLLVFTGGEVVIRDGNRNRVVCNTHVYAYSIARNALFDVLSLADQLPKRICGTSVGYLNALFIYGGFNNMKKSLSTISVVTLSLADKSVFPRPYSLDGAHAEHMDDHELGYKRLLYGLNRKNDIVNSRYGRRLFERNQIV